MTWQQLVDAAEYELISAGIDDARTNAEYLASHVLHQTSRSSWRQHAPREINAEEQDVFNALVQRRLRREPLQYILGEWEFFGLPMIVRPGALIPRPETEVLVEEALKEAAKMRDDIFVVDGGTGSGVIAVALASRLPNATVIGYDVSEAALDIARENKARLDLPNVEFRSGSMLADDWLRDLGQIDLLVSNPPYVSLEDFQTLDPELRLFEPREALTDGASGLAFYYALIKHAQSALAPKGRLLVELGYDVSQDVQHLAEEAGLNVLRIVKDLAGIDRVLVAARMA